MLASGIINLEVTTPSGATASASKRIGVNAPYYTDVDLVLYNTGGSPVSYMCPNTHYHIYLSNTSGCSLSNYDWTIPQAWSENYTFSNMISVYTGSTPGGRVEVEATTCCGVTASIIIDYFYSDYCGSSYSMSFSPNPSTGETTLTLELVSTDSELESNAIEPAFENNEEWDLEVYDAMQNLKHKKTKLKGKSTTINTQSWKEGVYMVRAKYKDQIITGKLVVKQ